MSADEAILWTRTVDAATSRPVATALTAQLAAEPEFRKILFTYKGATDPARAGTIKIEATGLNSHTRYFYRFVSDTGEISPIGRFTTAPRDDETVTVRFAFSGDAHGAWRPYPLVQRFGELNLDYFVFLGDTMYETASDLCISGRARSRWVCTLIPMMRASSSNKQYIGSAIDESSLMT